MSDRPLQAQQDTIRLPVYDVEGFRTDWPLLDQTLINCFAEIIRNPTTGDGEIVTTKRPGIARAGTLDFSTHLTDPTTAYPIANYTVPNLYDVYIAAIFDTANIRIIQYRPQANTTALLGSIAVGNAGDKVYISHGWTGDAAAPVTTLLVTWESGAGTSTKGYYAEVTGSAFAIGSLTAISATYDPWSLGKLTRGPILQLNQQFYVATQNGQIYNTGTVKANTANVKARVMTAGAEEGWTNALNFINSLVPDQFLRLIRYKHHILAIGKTSIQFFSDVGNSLSPSGGGTPIQGTDQAFIKFGAISGYHVINVDDIIYWVAYGPDNTVGLWKLDGYTPVKVSNKRQDNQFRDMANSDTTMLRSQLFTLVCGNKKHIGCGGMYAYTRAYSYEGTSDLTNATQTMFDLESTGYFGMYNLEDKTWWYMSLGTTNINLFYPTPSFGNPYGDGVDPYKQYILKGGLNGEGRPYYIYTMTEGTYLDDYVYTGARDVTNRYILSAVQFNNVNFSTEKRKRINKAKVIFGTNLAYNSGDANIYSLSLIVAKSNAVDTTNVDDFTARPIQIPNNYHRYYWNNLGMSRNWMFCIMEKSPIPMTIKALELDLAQGIS